METHQIFTFATTIETLKKMERFKDQFYWKDYPQPPFYESVAAHTWRVAVLTLLFQDKLSQKLNLEKALKMVLIHDLPEIYAGDESPMGKDGTGKDTYAFSSAKATQRHQNEKEGAHKLFSLLPEQDAQELYGLWLEYEQQISFEAKVIKALDKIECMLQVLEYRNGHMFPEHLEFTISYAMKNASVDPAIAAFGNMVAEQMRAKFKPFENEKN